jgi:hypothetical protein
MNKKWLYESDALYVWDMNWMDYYKLVYDDDRRQSLYKPFLKDGWWSELLYAIHAVGDDYGE